MPVLIIGATQIPYQVRFSTKARRKRIVVTPDKVEVVVPVDAAIDGPDGVESYVYTKRRWLFDAVRQLAAKHRKLLTQRYASGAKLQYHGRWLMLAVTSASVVEVEITCRSKFHVAVPAQLVGVARLEAIAAAFKVWLRRRAARDLRHFGRRYAAALGVDSEGFRLSEAKTRWGPCGRDGVIRVHWRLIQAPAAAMEYVVAHEVVHLLHRSHGPEFWAALAGVLPDWAERKRMMERWEGEHRAV